MVRKYFTASNSAGGFVNLMENNLAGIDRVITLSGDSKKQKTEIFESLLKETEDAECSVSPFDIKNIDAVILREKGVAVVDMDCIPTEISTKNIDLCVVNHKPADIVFELLKKENLAIEKMYKCYDDAKIIHDEWEKIYMGNMDYKRLEAYEKGVIEHLFADKKGTFGKRNYHRFFGASTPDGSVNYIDNLTESLSERFFIKGRAGTGKSTFLKRIVGAANERGFDTEIYYCSFDNNSLDMVIVPELGFCVFDSTAPHEMFPQTKRDKILDFYEESGLLGTDEKYEKELFDVQTRYKHKISQGMAYLRLCKLYMKEREYYLEKGLCEKEFLKLKDAVIREIL